MNLAVTVIEIVAPVFLLAGVEVIWVRAGQDDRLQFVARPAMTRAMLCLIFASLMPAEVGALPLRLAVLV